MSFVNIFPHRGSYLLPKNVRYSPLSANDNVEISEKVGEDENAFENSEVGEDNTNIDGDTNDGVDLNTNNAKDSNEIVEAVLLDLINQMNPKFSNQRDKKKKYNCDKCDYSTKDNYNLKRHRENMHNQVQVQCLKCEAVFNSKFKYIHHSLTCFYLCPYSGCSKKFKIDYKFNAHKRKHLKMLRRLI